MARLKPIAKERRHPVDYRDELEHEAIVEILSDLPDDHILIYAYYTAAQSTASTFSMTHLVGASRMDIVERLSDAAFAGISRIAHGCATTRTDGTLRPLTRRRR